MAREMETADALLQPEQDTDMEAGAPILPSQSRSLPRSAAIIAAIALVVLVATNDGSIVRGMRTIATNAAISFEEEPTACSADLEHSCPDDWTDGGYHCADHDGCREKSKGPFPSWACKDQCVILPQAEEIKDCDSKDSDAHCPPGVAGYHCLDDHDGCRTKAEGPFPAEDCKDQCAIAGSGVTVVPVTTPTTVASVTTPTTGAPVTTPTTGAPVTTPTTVAAVTTPTTGAPAVAGGSKVPDPVAVPVCEADRQHVCPPEWIIGGYHCKETKGCRSTEEGPFPAEDCETQCRIIGDSSTIAPVAPVGTTAPAAPVERDDAVPDCGADEKHQCPADWEEGGYHCQSEKGGKSSEAGGCRTAAEGAFPSDSCPKQCFIKAS